MSKIRVGVSGWSYDAWRGDFYPRDLPRKAWLRWISRRFDSLEANGSFYSLLSPSTYRSWYEQTPRGHRIALKGSRFITHNKKLGDVRVALANFLASGVLALREKLGPILWQLSERQTFDRERLESFLDLLPRDTRAAARLAGEHDGRIDAPLLEVDRNHRIRHVLEPRHGSFFAPDALDVLRRARVALAISHAERWPMHEEVTASFAYVRLHGAPDTYASRYADEDLDGWAKKIRAWSRRGDVFVYFDNDAHGHAPHDAERLAARLR
ncbi:MAG: DUF72 domain-containing protein [Gemmatimonadales bacterium]